jgi:hypothetical protein
MFGPQWPVGGRVMLCGVLVSGVLLAGSADSLTVAAAESAVSKIPDFGIGSEMAWHEIGDEFLPPPSGPRPVTNDPRYPYISPAVARRTNTQSTYRIADLTNPILQPWAAEQMRKANDAVLAGGVAFRPRERCLPGGVPEFVIFALVEPFYFLQTPREVTIINRGGPEIRHVYLNVPHSGHVKPSWYGESVGHYEGGDTLVVDTIGLSTKSYVDNYRTPHSENLHVVERFKMSADRKVMEDFITVDDPGAFTRQWSGSQRFNIERSPLEESVCAENNVDFFHYDVVPMPQAGKSDF